MKNLCISILYLLITFSATVVLYKKYKKFTNIMKKLGSFMKFWTKKVLMGIINSVYAIMYDTRVKKEKTDAGLPARATCWYRGKETDRHEV